MLLVLKKQERKSSECFGYNPPICSIEYLVFGFDTAFGSFYNKIDQGVGFALTR